MASNAKRPRYSESGIREPEGQEKIIDILKREAMQIQSHLQNMKENAYPSLQTDINNLKNDVMSFIQNLEKMANEVEQKQKDISNLQNAVDELTSRVKDLEETQKMMNLGQLAIAFERNVSKFLLKPDVLVSDYGGFTYMLNIVNAKEEELVDITMKRSGKHYLKEEEKIEIQKQKKESWEKFQDINNLTWTPNLSAAIKGIKEDRNHIAHPKLDYDQMEEEITTCCEHNDQLVLRILETVKTLNSVLGIGHCATKFQEAVVRFVFPKKKISFANMIKRLNENSSKNAAAKKLWAKLSVKSWTKEHYEALEELKKLGRERCVLQNIDFNRAESDVNKFVPKKYADHCSDIIAMVKELSLHTGKEWELPKNV